MKILKITLIVLLVLVTVLYGFTAVFQKIGGKADAPVISCDSDVLELSVTDDETALLRGITASDKQDGDMTAAVRIAGISKFIDEATARVNYLVFDSDHNVGSLSRTIRYTDYVSPRFTITEPLIYKGLEKMQLLDRIQATDCLDGDVTSAVRVSEPEYTDEEELYYVTLRVTNSMDDSSELKLPVIQQYDNASRPEIKLNSYLIYLPLGSSFNPRDYISYVSTDNGIVGKSEVQSSGTVNTDEAGTYMVRYTYAYDDQKVHAFLTVVVE